MAGKIYIYLDQLVLGSQLFSLYTQLDIIPVNGDFLIVLSSKMRIRFAKSLQTGDSLTDAKWMRQGL